MSRHEHFIKPTKGNKMPKYYGAIGISTKCDTFNSIQTYQLESLESWHLITFELKDSSFIKYRNYYGTTTVEFWNVMTKLLSRGGTLWMFGFGGASILSALGFWERLEDETFVLKGSDPWCDGEDDAEKKSKQLGLAVLEDPPTHLLGKIVGRAGNLKFLDIRNYGVETQQELNDDYGNRENPGIRGGTAQNGYSSIAYCNAAYAALFIQDIVQFLQRSSLGSLQSTAASQSYYSFRRSYLHNGILVHSNKGVLSIERQSLHGGRCEVFRFGAITERIFHFDFRSMYPSVCIGQALPIAFSHSMESISADELRRVMRTSLVIADVTLSTKRNAFPMENGGIVVWPVGTFRTSLAGPELLEALDNEEIITVHQACCYEGWPILTDYMRDMYGWKEQFHNDGKQSMQSFIKKMLVSCIGKFGQRNKRWVDNPNEIATDPYQSWYGIGKDGKPCRFRSVAWYVQREETEDEGPESCPAITSYIMSLARMKLWKAMKTCGLSNVVYVDTDSLFVNTNGMEKLCSDTTLVGAECGMLRLVGQTDELTILGIKHYHYGKMVVCAGLPKGQHSQVNDKGEYWFREWLSAAVQMGHRPEAVRVLKKVTRNFTYLHGMVISDGRVEPWHIDQRSVELRNHLV